MGYVNATVALHSSPLSLVTHHRSAWSSGTHNIFCQRRMGASCAPGWCLTLCWVSLTSNMTARSAYRRSPLDLVAQYRFRYSLQLVDTVQIAAEKAICLTSGVKSIKDTMFFLNQEDEADTKAAPSKKPPTTKANGNASPAKNKMAGGKVLRNKTRGAAQEEAIQTAAAKIAEHQRELHQRLQEEGLAKHSEGAGGYGRNEGKGWKRFQSYKGEAALPKEAESLRVRVLHIHACNVSANNTQIDFRRSQGTDDHTPHSRLRGAIPHQHDQEC